MKRRNRTYTAPKSEDRCMGDVTLSDGSLAQCMHRREKGREYCRQHGETDELYKILKEK